MTGRIREVSHRREGHWGISAVIIVLLAVGVARCGVGDYDNGSGRASGFETSVQSADTGEVVFGSFIEVDRSFQNVIDTVNIVTPPTQPQKPPLADPRFCDAAWDYYKTAKQFIDEKLALAQQYPLRAIDKKVAEKVNEWAVKIKERLKNLRTKLNALETQGIALPQDWVTAFNHAESIFDQSLQKYNDSVRNQDITGVNAAIQMLQGDLKQYLYQFLAQPCPAPFGIW